MRWKVVPAAAAFALLATGVACGGGSSSSPSNASSGGASVDPASVTGTIRLLSYSDGFDPAYLKGFHQEYPNVTIEATCVPRHRHPPPTHHPNRRRAGLRPPEHQRPHWEISNL